MASSTSSEKKFLLLKNVVVSSELRKLKGSPTFMAESLTKWKKFSAEAKKEKNAETQTAQMWRIIVKPNQLRLKLMAFKSQ